MQREPPLDPRWSETSDVIPMFATLVRKIELEAQLREAICAQAHSTNSMTFGISLPACTASCREFCDS
jgi:hypothetical protein